jgi:hypothetical protein
MRRGEFFGLSAISVAESLTGDDFLREVSFVASYMTFPGTCRACPVVSQLGCICSYQDTVFAMLGILRIHYVLQYENDIRGGKY